MEDAKAWKKLLDYLRKEIPGGQLTEYAVACKLQEFRKECPDYVGESFQPIVAWNANAASPHYAPAAQGSAVIGNDGFLLIDTGAQYRYGTTDTTRTIPLGKLTDVQREDYSRVLKGMVDLSMARFPKGTRGSQLDILARLQLFQVG